MTIRFTLEPLKAISSDLSPKTKPFKTRVVHLKDNDYDPYMLMCLFYCFMEG